MWWPSVEWPDACLPGCSTPHIPAGAHEICIEHLHWLLKACYKLLLPQHQLLLERGTDGKRVFKALPVQFGVAATLLHHILIIAACLI